MDGSVFDPNKVVDYIYNAPIKHPKVTKEALAKVNKWTVK
jgi:nitrate/nitrite transport system substrate-binding protein